MGPVDARVLLAAGVLSALAAAAALYVRDGTRSSESATAARLERATIADIEAGRRTTPLVGPLTDDGQYQVTFLARASAGIPPRIVSDATGWGEQPGERFSFEIGRMTLVKGANEGDGTKRAPWYSLVARVAPGARIEYLVAYAPGDYRADPHNPRRARFRGSPASEFVAPGYVPNPETDDPRVAVRAGRAIETTFESRALSGPVEVIVYTPAGYSAHRRYPVAVFHDRLHWGREGAGPRTLDRLVGRGKIEPIVAVFADSGRVDGGGRPGALRAFLADELLRWLASRYAVTAQADERAILGVSYGAKDALEAALLAPDGFGRVGLLIPGRRLTPADIEALAERRARRIQVAILAGFYDAPNLETARRARRVLAAAGHAVHYTEVSEGHNAATWRDHAGAVLAALFPPVARGPAG
jgi:enterochelin esterase-like enzyme